MYIETVPNRNSPPCILLRESYRENGKVRKRTIANITNWPEELVENFRKLIKGGTVVDSVEDAFDIQQSLPHGHVAAVFGTLRRLGLDKMIDSKPSAMRNLVVAIITARIVDPDSKLATARGLDADTSFSSLCEMLDLETVSADALYEAMDWLDVKQEKIEKKLAKRHLEEGSLVLYDLTSTYFEGHTCPLAEYGHSRDGKKDKLQIVFGLLCNSEGCPVAVEVFEGNTGDPSTLKSQINKLRNRFGLKQVVLVGDRGMITEARLEQDVKEETGFDWITALRAPRIKEMVNSGVLQLGLFDQQDLAEVNHPDYPGERLIVCRNPILADERARKRQELLAATERELEKIVQATSRKKRPLKGRDQIGIRVGKVLNRFKMAKHFHIDIGEDSFSYSRSQQSIADEEALDGFYVIRTSVSQRDFSSEEVVGAYKQLSAVERAFRSFKIVDLKVRPIYHRLETRVRSHVFLCMLAYYVEWHMKKDLAPILFEDNMPQAGKEARSSIVAPSQRSAAADRKAHNKRTDDFLPVHSFRTLLKDLSTLTKNLVTPRLSGAVPFFKMSTPTEIQQRALDLLRVKL